MGEVVSASCSRSLPQQTRGLASTVESRNRLSKIVQVNPPHWHSADVLSQLDLIDRIRLGGERIATVGNG